MKNTKTLSELENKYIGAVGTKERNEYERALSDLMIGRQVRDARIRLDLTQEELAERIIAREVGVVESALFIIVVKLDLHAVKGN